ncbi:DUF2264 domain-containing protein [Myceligenerans pegani]|uniref:DUF2264 domain-containing protein n=1 Tax=Myceligenerans pegani TaxID=2776917 RepID=A0ABR9N6D5_9MICO|nr:DUF2264 domain-containing protein [Myceligenerans sp. TRM 65318]MBE1878751.1 DUF2264 domain-containing protein [Myceligenerans sp. TRM 65318]MBE3021022.1 DUF2264 domain-containing protein [Myceligenerans sp. TRM 65318]
MTTQTRRTQAPSSPLGPARRWTRDRWLDLADDLLAATESFSSPGRALVSLPGPVSASGRWSDGLEGYARTFLLAAFRVRGEDGADPHGLLERFATGLAHGTDPRGAERWPTIAERRQAVVEAASVAAGLSETRPWLWDRLDAGTRERTVDWLAGVVGTDGYGNNWLWFQNVIEEFLRSVGGPWDQADLDRNHELAERLYVGDGWYSDGTGRDGSLRSFDWYAGWAWHFYPVLHARIAGRPLERRHAERLRAYLGQAQHLVGPDGAPLLQGRSATYRFATLAPFWAGALADATPLRPGQTRALTAAVLDHFTSAGAVDDDGLLPVGWHGRYDRIRQLYSGAASPYWASKAFLGLLLPAEDPVWSSPAELPGPWTRDDVVLLRAPGWLVSATTGDGLVRVLNHGSDRLREGSTGPRADDPFYRRLGYSTATSPQLAAEAVAWPAESHVALLDAAGRPSHRDAVVPVHLTDHVAVSRSRVHWLDLPGGDDLGGTSNAGDAAGFAGLRHGPWLVTASVVRGRHEVRLAWWEEAGPAASGPADGPDHDAAWPRDPGPWTVRLGGWPLADDDAAALASETAAGRARVTRADGLSSLVVALRGLDRAGTVERTGADPLGRASVTPWLADGTPSDPGEVAAALVVLTGEPLPEDPASVARVVVHDGSVRVLWADGAVDVVPVAHATDGHHPPAA